MKVELAPRALEQIRQVDRWWRHNRPSAPTLFAEELAGALERMAHGDLFGVARRV